jgi:hypothetical protein
MVGGEGFTATTYADWGRFLLEPKGGVEQVLEPEGRSPLDFVLASASHPGAFVPAVLNRSDDADAYRRHGISNFPESEHIWYTDGGLMQSQPLGYVLAAARVADQTMERNSRFRRAVVLIDPRSEDPSGGSEWTDPEQTPDWLKGLRRALEILPAQSIYEDASRIEKSNTRIAWTEDFVESLAPHLADGAEGALRALLERAAKHKHELAREDEVPEARSLTRERPANTRELLHRAVSGIAGLDRKETVDVSVISPLLLAEDAGSNDIPALLAGDFMGDFGGFLSREIRHSDFLLGYASAEAWLPDGLRDAGLNHDALSAAAEEVAARSPGHWQDANQGGVEARDLTWAGRLAMARLAWDALKALTSDALGIPRLGDGARRSKEKAEHLLEQWRRIRSHVRSGSP